MPEHVGADAIDDSYVAIGWSDVGNIFEIPANREAYKTRLIDAYPNKKPGAIPVDAGTLFRFAHEIKRETILYFLQSMIEWLILGNSPLNMNLLQVKKTLNTPIEDM